MHPLHWRLWIETGSSDRYRNERARGETRKKDFDKRAKTATAFIKMSIFDLTSRHCTPAHTCNHLLCFCYCHWQLSPCHCLHTCAKFNCHSAAGVLNPLTLITDPDSQPERWRLRVPGMPNTKKEEHFKGRTAPSLPCVIFALGLASSIQKTWWNLTDDFLYLNTFEINRRSSDVCFVSEGWLIYMDGRGWVECFLYVRVSCVQPDSQGKYWNYRVWSDH